MAYANIFISEITRLDFAVLEVPSVGQRFITILPEGNVIGTGEVLSGMPQRGEYFITGPFSQHNETISIDIQNIDSGSPEIEFSRFRGIYNNRRILNFPAWGLQNPGPQGKTLFLGATARYTNQVEEGIYHPSYDIVITYE